ncbi:hypothetical protein ACFO9E_28745 [Streptomyces maoxianensis]|uniref:Uncharacterized protein n=1 Tax=Streptomyces maoxianensis TaxID=1459942 RepID=A0ABV9GF97_9ACTN
MTADVALSILANRTTVPRDERKRAEVLAAFAALQRLTTEEPLEATK